MSLRELRTEEQCLRAGLDHYLEHRGRLTVVRREIERRRPRPPGDRDDISRDGIHVFERNAQGHARVALDMTRVYSFYECVNPNYLCVFQEGRAGAAGIEIKADFEEFRHLLARYRKRFHQYDETPAAASGVSPLSGPKENPTMLTKTRAQSLRAIKHRAEEMDESQAKARPMGPGETAMTSLLVMGNDYAILRDTYLRLHEGSYEDVVGLLVNIGACAGRVLDALQEPGEDAGSEANDASDGGSLIQKQNEIEAGDLVHLKGGRERTAFEVVEVVPIAGATTIVTLQSTEDDSEPFDVAADMIAFASPQTGNPPGLRWFQRLVERHGNAEGLKEAMKRGERATGNTFQGMDELVHLGEALDGLSKGQPGDVGAILSQLEAANRRAAA